MEVYKSPASCLNLGSGFTEIKWVIELIKFVLSFEVERDIQMDKHEECDEHNDIPKTITSYNNESREEETCIKIIKSNYNFLNFQVDRKIGFTNYWHLNSSKIITTPTINLQ